MPGIAPLGVNQLICIWAGVQILLIVPHCCLTNPFLWEGVLSSSSDSSSVSNYKLIPPPPPPPITITTGAIPHLLPH